MKTGIVTIDNKIPVDSVALRVILPGEHFIESPVKFNKDFHVFNELPILISVKKGTTNLIGLKVDRLTVVGLYKIVARSSAVRKYWCCKCLCGRYVVRSQSILLKKDRKSKLMCPYCESTLNLLNSKKKIEEKLERKRKEGKLKNLSDVEIGDRQIKAMNEAMKTWNISFSRAVRFFIWLGMRYLYDHPELLEQEVKNDN